MATTLGLIVGLAFVVILFTTGAPMFVAFIAGCILLVLYYANWSGIAIVQLSIASVDAFLLVAIPLFILAGNIMASSGATAALFDLARAFVGHLRAGLGMSAIIACALFGTMCGSTVATAVAVGTVVVPELSKSNYSKSLGAAICGTAGCLGILIPPSIPMIVLGELTNVSVGRLFMAGIVPGIMTAVLLCVACYVTVSQRSEIRKERKYSWGERKRVIFRALPAFIMPLGILGSIYTGIATPTESAAIAVVLALALGLMFYRGLTWGNFMEAAKDTAISTSAVYMIIVGATVFGAIFGYMRVPQEIAVAVGAIGLSKEVFLLTFLVVFFFAGMVFDAFALYFLCLAPLLPTITSYGFDMVSFCIMFVLVVMVGQVTPPVGITLYAAAASSQAPTGETIRESMPYLVAMVIAMLLVAFFPQLSLLI